MQYNIKDGFTKEIADDKFIYEDERQKNAIKVCLTNKAPEILGKEENKLLENKNFIGFYIDGKIDKFTRKVIKTNPNCLKHLLKQK